MFSAPEKFSRQAVFFLGCLFVLAAGALSYKPSAQDIKTVAVVYSIGSLVLMSLVLLKPESIAKKWEYLFAAALLIDGTLIRLALAWSFQGNYDGVSWELAAERYWQGLDPYSNSIRYNSSPVWFWILGALKGFQSRFPSLSFHFIYGSLLTAVDLGIYFILSKIFKIKNIPFWRGALFFYFNPISFLLTGYQGQFDSLAIFWVLLGLYIFLSRPGKEGAFLSWACCTAAVVIKQIVFFQVVVILNNSFRKNSVRLILFGVTGLIFLGFLGIYWEAGRESIIKNVLLYSSYSLNYGISSVAKAPVLKWFFVAGLFAAPFFIRKKPVERQMLLMMLFFLVFTTGVGTQYFILPVALGALTAGVGFYIYSAAVTVFLLGSYYNLSIHFLSFVPWNLVWAAALLWLILVLKSPGPPKDS